MTFEVRGEALNARYHGPISSPRVFCFDRSSNLRRARRRREPSREHAEIVIITTCPRRWGSSTRAGPPCSP